HEGVGPDLFHLRVLDLLERLHAALALDGMIWDRDVLDQRFEQSLAPPGREMLKNGAKPNRGDQLPNLEPVERNLGFCAVTSDIKGVGILTIERDRKLPKRGEAARRDRHRGIVYRRGGN